MNLSIAGYVTLSLLTLGTSYLVYTGTINPVPTSGSAGRSLPLQCVRKEGRSLLLKKSYIFRLINLKLL